MNKSLIAYTIFAFSILFIASCQKKDDTTPDPSKVTITVLNPQDQQTISHGDTLHIDANITYPSELHGYEIQLTNTTTGEVLFDDDEHVHDDHFTIADMWVDTLNAPVTLQLKITVEIDHNGNEATKVITINHGAATGNAMLHFTNTAGNQLLTLNSGNYTTASGSSITVSKFNYYISNIRFNNTNGSSFSEPESYHLLQQSDASSLSFNIGNIPAGTYGSVSFMIGVDSTHNTSGAQTGALDPVNGMFWSWNTGYIMAKMEGTSPQAGSTDNTFIFHIGGFSGVNSALHTVTLNLPAPLTIHKNSNAMVHLHADALAWFAPNSINLGTVYNIMNISPTSKMISDNYAGMFAADSVKN
ncbi:MbnP family protein [Chitinophagaceae bacterium MMS25-I14]